MHEPEGNGYFIWLTMNVVPVLIHTSSKGYTSFKVSCASLLSSLAAMRSPVTQSTATTSIWIVASCERPVAAVTRNAIEIYWSWLT